MIALKGFENKKKAVLKYQKIMSFIGGSVIIFTFVILAFAIFAQGVENLTLNILTGEIFEAIKSLFSQ